MKVTCPNCDEDIREFEFSIDSDVNGIINIGYDCDKCKLEVYLYYVKKQDEEEDEI